MIRDDAKHAQARLDRVNFLAHSARVARYHTEPVLRAQSVGEHTFSVVTLVLELTLWRASRDLLVAALLHDAPERETGDAPSPTKRGAVREAFDKLEADVMEGLGFAGIALDANETYVLKLADTLEGAMFCAFELRRGNREIRRAFWNYLSYLRRILDEADEVGAAWSLGDDIHHQLSKEFNNVFG